MGVGKEKCTVISFQALLSYYLENHHDKSDVISWELRLQNSKRVVIHYLTEGNSKKIIKRVSNSFPEKIKASLHKK